MKLKYIAAGSAALSLFFLGLLFQQFYSSPLTNANHDINVEGWVLPYVEGQIFIKWRGDIRSSDILSTFSDIEAASVESDFRVADLSLVTLRTRMSIKEALLKLRRNPNIEYAEPNYYQYAFAGFFPPAKSKKPALNPAPGEPNGEADPLFGQTWGVKTVRAPEVWPTWMGSHDVIVGVIDTGIDYNHEDLAYNLWRNEKEIPGNNVDDDNNGYVDDLVGWDFVANEPLPYDDNRHGTHVSGTIGAVGENGKGTIGVSPRILLMGVKFLDSRGSGKTNSAIKAIEYAAFNGARVLNNSWGGGSYSKALEDTIEETRKEGVLFVAAAGNSGNNIDNKPSYPASYKIDNIIAVAATDQNDKLASWSNYGKQLVHLAAPGVDTLSTTPNNDYQLLSGTSMATPHVVGAAALVWSAVPDLTYDQLKRILIDSVRKVPNLDGSVVSSGVLDVENALKHATGTGN